MGLRFVDLWRWDGRVSRKTYALVGFAGFVIKHFVDHFIAAGFFHAYGFFNYWVPLGRGAHLTHLTTDEGKFLATMLLVAMPFLWVGLAMTVRRLRDAGQPVWWVVLFFFPILNLLFFLLLCFLPSRQQAEREEAAPWPAVRPLDGVIPRSQLGSAVLSIVVTTAIGLLFVLLGTAVVGAYGWSLFVPLDFPPPPHGEFHIVGQWHHRPHRTSIAGRPRPVRGPLPAFRADHRSAPARPRSRSTAASDRRLA